MILIEKVQKYLEYINMDNFQIKKYQIQNKIEYLSKPRFTYLLLGIAFQKQVQMIEE